MYFKINKTLLSDSISNIKKNIFGEISIIIPIFIFIVFAYLQSIFHHLNYFSNNWDLGFHNQLMYKWANFMTPSSTLWNPTYPMNHCFGDHVTLLMPIHSHLYWIFGSSALLVVQILYMCIGYIGMNKLVFHFTSNHLFSISSGVLFFLHYSIWAALFFDEHDNVYGMMFLPWIFYFYYSKKFKWFAISSILFLMGRDDLAITGIAIGAMCLMLDYKTHLKYSVTLLSMSLSYFILCHYLIIPTLSTAPSGYAAWRFNHLGKNVPEVALYIATNPIDFFSYFIDQPAKLEKLFYFIYTGGLLVFINWRIFAAIIPTFLITCLSDSLNLWGNWGHYNIVFAVTLPFLVCIVIHKYIASKYYVLCLILSAIIYFLALNTSRFNSMQRFSRMFNKEYYKRRANKEDIRSVLSVIPIDAAVSATNFYTPHLAFRQKSYFFPDVKDAEYIFMNEMDTIYNCYPFKDKEEFKKVIQEYKSHEHFELIKQQNGVLLFKRK